MTAWSLDNRSFTWFAAFLIALGGVYSFFQLGKLEDPTFTVKSAIITTTYPGADPETVELEVTDRIERKIQELHQLKELESWSRSGLSIIKVTMKDQYWSDQIPQVWDELRNKVSDVAGQLPPGAGAPLVADDFAEVYGFVLALTGDGYSYAELEDYAKAIQHELGLVQNAARCEIWGTQPRCVYIDVAQSQLSNLGLTTENLVATLRQQNLVVDSGAMDWQDRRPRIELTGEFNRPEDIGQLTIRANPIDRAGQQGGLFDRDELLQLSDVGQVKSGYIDPPPWLMRYNGQPALALYISNVAGSNIVDLGRALDRRLDELLPMLPVGIELHKVAWQSELVSKSISEFMVNLLQSALIVLAVLWLTTGLRTAIVVVAGGLVLVILGTLIVMNVMQIDLHRVSLGAMVIAMGIMVNNACVVTYGIQTRIVRGMPRREAAVEACNQNAWPLLGATVIAVMAFYPIYGSPYAAGEYCRSLFQCVAISLLVSWVLALTLVPLMTISLLPATAAGGSSSQGFADRASGIFRRHLAWIVWFRWLFLLGLTAAAAAAVAAFGAVPRIFFPDATRAQFMIDYWAPEGTRIQEVSAELRRIEALLLEDEKLRPMVESVSTFVGRGPPRFYLPVEPEMPTAAYGQCIVNTRNFRDVDALIAQLDPWVRENVPNGLVRLRRYMMGAGTTWPISVRFSGSAFADRQTLRQLGDRGMAILYATPQAREVRTDWRQPVENIFLDYNSERGRWTGVTRDALAGATRWFSQGAAVGLFRDRDDLLPILVRQVEGERQNIDRIDLVPVQPNFATFTVPLAQVVDRVRLEWRDPIIARVDRRRCLTVQCSPHDATAQALRNAVREQFEAIPLPPGYTVEWAGEYRDSVESQNGLRLGIPLALAVSALIIVALYNELRPVLIVVLFFPYTIIGIAAGLLLTGSSFGFMALLGALSLFGLSTTNAIVLLDAIRREHDSGKSRYQALIDATLSRVVPVFNAAATTVLAMIPLLQDVLWSSMAVTIMFGLSLSTLLTYYLMPALYAALYRVAVPGPEESTAPT